MSMSFRAFFSLALLTFLVSLSSAIAAEPPSHRYSVAVIIGNKTYEGRIPEVAYAHRDADAMKAYLTQVLGYREGNIIDLRDATQAELMSAFGNERSHEGKLWRYVRKGRSHVTVFYSGHGVPGLKDGRGYLLPVNADPDTPEINGYSVDLLYKNLAQLEAKSITVYLDACFSGESDQGMLIRSASPVFVQSKMPEAAAELTVLTAASSNQVASWDEENKHGLFTWHLLQALNGEADQEPFGNGDGQVTMAEAKAYLDEELTYAAQRRFGRIQNATVRGEGSALLGVVPEAPAEMPSKPAAQVAARGSAFEVAEMDTVMVVAQPRVNSRAGPGTTFEKVATLTQGTEVEVTGKVEGKDWYRVALSEGQIAFVFAPLLADSLETPAQPAVGVYPEKRKPGDTFKDCDVCPEMVVVPAGTFQMGSPSYEEGRMDNESPLHPVTIRKPFAVGRFEVTKAEYDSFVTDTGHVGSNRCSTYEDGKREVREFRNWRDPGFRQSNRDPALCLGWPDVSAYVSWLSRKTGKAYRVPSESEWEYVARAGTSTARFWGDDSALACRFASTNDKSTKAANEFTWTAHECDDGAAHTAPVGSYQPNAFGLFDTLGSAWEWTGDCWNESYAGAPSDGSAWTSGDCKKRVVRGGSWESNPGLVRSARRAWTGIDYWSYNHGIRVVRALDQ